MTAPRFWFFDVPRPRRGTDRRRCSLWTRSGAQCHGLCLAQLPLPLGLRPALGILACPAEARRLLGGSPAQAGHPLALGGSRFLIPRYLRRHGSLLLLP